eukprot:GGOE01007928.1.p2 GENE.GGOE01007928.1~~GGOE01007928.1.p2  ORF type:complete len:175 (-),score=18.66 GGOE01007928.1:416-904(-)
MDKSQRCQHQRGPKERCMMSVKDGQSYCEAHLCPGCQKDKASNSSTCAGCSSVRTLPPPLGTPETCHYEGPTGRCTLQRRFETYFCTAHACPVCKQQKEEGAKKCLAHMQPCKQHAWEDSGMDMLLKRCKVCDCSMSGRQTLKCKECGGGAHRRCITSNTVA